MRRAANLDRNHNEIVTAFLGLGVSVKSAARFGDGWPDLSCGYLGQSHWVEVKDDPPGTKDGEPNEKQQEWLALWRGDYTVVRTVEDVGRLVKSWRQEAELKGKGVAA